MFERMEDIEISLKLSTNFVDVAILKSMKIKIISKHGNIINITVNNSSF